MTLVCFGETAKIRLELIVFTPGTYDSNLLLTVTGGSSIKGVELGQDNSTDPFVDTRLRLARGVLKGVEG